ncbi:nitrate reductase associated protein [Gloeocapsa sp. PCC 73106]|uniref:nitrate reductase associated protein n=1 Tax=Gloeocapsa sp. PCC 73106 TaxID=102232 RepID=UPI000557813D|nr:nitrate reductase associated protein [Gloeocapsa sp. PCC 73106]
MTFFQFEADFVESLRCIPMQVRYKLDTCGVKLKLPHWNRFSQTERQQLVEVPCVTDNEVRGYREMLHELVGKHGGDRPSDLPIDPIPEWHNLEAIPSTVQAQSSRFDVILTVEQWKSLTPLQRFALIKLSRSNHENSNFLPALKEFILA